KSVAQTFLSAVSRVFQPAGIQLWFGSRASADRNVGDTAGRNACATCAWLRMGAVQNPKLPARLLGRIICSVIFLFHCPTTARADSATTNAKPARIKISGYGLFGNRELRRMLVTLELGGKRPVFFESSFVEDATLLLNARVKRDGYLKPSLTLRLTLA